MGDMAEIFNAYKEGRKVKKRNNKKESTELLIKHDIKFTSKNNGSHLIVEGLFGPIDFWPSTGRFITRNGRKGRGVRKLIKECKP